MNPKTAQKFSDEFLSEEKELIVLSQNTTNGAALYGDMWRPSNHPLAYIEVATDELYKGNIRLEWLVETDSNWKYYFESLKAFRIKARPKKPELSHPQQHCFMLVEVLEEDVKNSRFQPIIDEYNTEVTYQDDDFSLELNRDFDWFEGDILYADQEVELTIETTELSKLEPILNHFRDITKDNFKAWIATLKTFAAEKLTDLANKWQKEEDDNAPDITPESFAERMSITNINISDDERFCIYFDDDDMFWGHTITIYGNLNGELKDATIEG